MEDKSEKPQEAPIKHGGYSSIWRRAVKGDLDGRSLVARAVRDLKDSIVRELGGVENVTTQKDIIIDRAVAKTFQCQIIERMLYEGEEINKGLEDLYLSTSNSLRKDLQALGLNRTPRNVTEVNMKFDLKKLSVEELDQLRALILKLEIGEGLSPNDEKLLKALKAKGGGIGREMYPCAQGV